MRVLSGVVFLGAKFGSLSLLCLFTMVWQVNGSSPAWIADCRGVTFNISGDCSNGIYWFEKAHVSPNSEICICVNGVWALSSSFCDLDTLVLAGQGDCFSIRKKIRKLTKLSENLQSATSQFASERRKFTFEPLPRTEVPGDQSLVIVRVNPSTDLFYKGTHQQICLDKHREKSLSYFSFRNVLRQLRGLVPSKPVSIIRITPRSPNSLVQFLEIETTPNGSVCANQNSVRTETVQSQTVELGPGEGMFLGSGKMISSALSDGNCSRATCTAREKARVRRQAYTDPEIEVKGFFGGKSLLEFDLAAQNVRVIKSEMMFLKDYVKNSETQLEDKNFQFMRMARHILNSVCPLAEVPIAFTKSITRIFKYLTVDQREDNLYGSMEVENGTFNRTMDILGQCYNESEPYEFIIEVAVKDCVENLKKSIEVSEEDTGDDAAGGDNATNSAPAGEETPAGTRKRRRRADGDEGDAEETQAPAQADSVCTCYRNYTGVKLNETTNNTCSPELVDPGNAWGYDTINPDFLVETMWKIFQFAHYQCAKYFAADGMDASMFFERVERLFTADIIYRWAKGNEISQKTWEYFYMGYHLPSIARGLDTCLCAAQAWSDYPRPMNRPRIPVFRRKRSVDETSDKDNEINLPTKATPTCLKHQWDPLQVVDATESCN